MCSKNIAIWIKSTWTYDLTQASWVKLLLPSAIRLGTLHRNWLCMLNGRVGAEGNESLLRNTNLYANFFTSSNDFLTPLLLWCWLGILDTAYYDCVLFLSQTRLLGCIGFSFLLRSQPDQPRGLVVRVWLLIMMYRVRFPALPWEDSRGDHGLGRLVEFRFKGPPGTTSSYITTHIIGTT